jgi:hypothetical protein
MPQRYSAAYVQLLQRGPFPGQIDPWAEAGRYFQQIHSGMINSLQDQLQDELNLRGYQVGKEASLQIFGNRKPDLYIQTTTPESDSAPDWDYAAVAAELEVDPGIAILEDEWELEALHIREMASNELVTVVEIISPRNKTHPADMQLYRDQRESLFLSQGVNVVEIDATRSQRRLLRAADHVYHTAVFLPGDLPRILISSYGEALKPFALPLDNEAVRVEPQAAYNRAYQRGNLAGLIASAGDYAAEALPFPSTLTEAQHSAAQDAVTHWQAELQRLGTET